MKKHLHIILKLLLVVLVVSCKKDEAIQSNGNSTDTLAIVKTLPITSIGMDSAVTGAEVTLIRNSSLQSAGLCWSTSPLPTINDKKSVHAVVNGVFQATVNRILPRTIYYVRAYAINNAGVSYGEQRIFATDSVIMGSYMRGGKLAYVFKPGDNGYVDGEFHGLIVNLRSFVRISWNGEIDSVTNANDSVLLSGYSNTEKIVSVLGQGEYAAKRCWDYSYDGYNDWFLPSLEEALKVSTLMKADQFWTSTEVDAKHAYHVRNGKKTVVLKTSPQAYCTIRKF